MIQSAVRVVETGSDVFYVSEIFFAIVMGFFGSSLAAHASLYPSFFV